MSSDVCDASVSPEPRPARIGGLSTPFGVFLTSGSSRGGVGDGALMATGALFAVSNAFLSILADRVPSIVGLTVSESARGFVVIGLFLIAMRLTAVTGYHAAEHQVVHAFEQGLPLTPDWVVHQPRAHRRCGTNVMAFMLLLMLQLVAAGDLGDLDPPLVLTAAGALALRLAPSVGFVMQQLVTTRPANARQIASALTAARQVLAAWQRQPDASRPLRFWRSGVPQVMLGALAAAGMLRVLH